MTELPSCYQCGHFQNEPLDVEAALPGLSALSSAYAAVRGGDGVCSAHDRYVTAASVCPAFVLRQPGRSRFPESDP
jgi:hypothetical protein